MMKKQTIVLTVMAAAGCMGVSAPAMADAIFHYDAQAQYKSVADSIFAAEGGSTYWIEDFEDGLLNSLGLSANTGVVKNPAKSTDSVDGDDGEIDGSGSAAHSYKINQHTGTVVLRFDSEVLGGAPTVAGFVWTDGKDDALVTVKAWDAEGNYLGKLVTTLGDGEHQGDTAADRFIGAESGDGISKLKVMVSNGFLEMDHIQYGMMASGGPSVVPLPAPVALGLAGLGIVTIARKRRANKRNA